MLIIQTAVVHHDARKMLSGFYRIETSYMRSKQDRRKVILFGELSKVKLFQEVTFFVIFYLPMEIIQVLNRLVPCIFRHKTSLLSTPKVIIEKSRGEEQDTIENVS